MPDPWYFVADVGGTNARFAAFQGDQLVATVTHKTAQCDDLLAAAKAFSDTLAERPAVVVVAAAGPVRDNAVTLTNAKHALSGEALRAATGANYAHVINDFAAAAWATFGAEEAHLSVISGTPRLAPGTRIVIGPGTGLGVGALVFDGTNYQAVTGEGGHVGTAPRNHYEFQVFEVLRRIWPEVFFGDTITLEAEGLLSGTGLPMLYRAVQVVEDLPSTPVTPAEIFAHAKARSDVAATKTIDIFKAHLARVTGDYGLVFGGNSGIVFVGGMAQKNPWLFDDAFVSMVGDGGRFSAARRELNLYLLEYADAALFGAQRYAKRTLATVSRGGKVAVSGEIGETCMVAHPAMEKR